MPPEKAVLFHDSTNYITIHTRTSIFQPVKGAATPEKCVEELVKTFPPSSIDATYILPGRSSYDVIKRTVAAFKNANYPNIHLIDNDSYWATSILHGADFEYSEGETILCYTHAGVGEFPEAGVPMVLKKVDDLFQFVDHIGETIYDILYYYPEIKKVIIHADDRSIAWDKVFAEKTIKFARLEGIQHEYVFNNYRRVKQITGIKMLINDGKKTQPLDLYHELVPMTKTVELLLPPERNTVTVWISHQTKKYVEDSSHTFTTIRGCMTKVAVTVFIDETIILPEITFKVIAYIPQVMTEIAFDSDCVKYSGNLIKADSQKNIAASCATSDDVFAAFESLPTTDHHVGIIVNYRKKFDMTVHKAIMSLVPEHSNVWIVPLHTALNVDLRHSATKVNDDEIVAVWYYCTNSDVFYVKKCKDQSLDMAEKVDEKAVKKVIIITKNAISKTVSQTVQKRFPFATIFNSNRETLPPNAHYEVAWDLLRNRRSEKYNMAPYSLGIRLLITLNDATVNIDKEKDYDISSWKKILPVGKTGGVVTVDMKHYALEDPVRLHEIKVESSKSSREAVIRLGVSHQFVAEVDVTLQKINSKNTAKNNHVIYTTFICANGYSFEAIFQDHFDSPAITFNKFELMVTHIAKLAPLSSVVAVIDFISNYLSLAEGKNHRDLLVAAGFNKIVPWDMFQLPLEECRITEHYDHGECMAIITSSLKKLFIRQNKKMKCLTDIEFQQEKEILDKFKVHTVTVDLLQILDSSYLTILPRYPLRYPIQAPYITELWNSYWAIAKGKNVVMDNASLEFMIEGIRRTEYKTGMVTLPHEFTIEIDVEAADNIKVLANCLHTFASKSPFHIATFNTTTLHDRVISVTIIVEDIYNVTAKFKAFASGHKKRVITRIVLMRQLETGIDRQTFSRGDKASVSDFALPSMLVALETYAHPELSAVIFITSGQNLNKYGRYVELARRFRFADIQICHEAVIETNRLLYGSDIDAEVGETMFIMNSSKYLKNFNKSYVIRKEVNRFKLLKSETDTIENLRKKFPGVTRITYEGLNPINDDASNSPLHSYLFARVDGTLRQTAVDDIDVKETVVSVPKSTLPKTMDRINFIIKFGNTEAIYTLKRSSFQNVLLNVGGVTKIEISSKKPDSNLSFAFPSHDFLAVDERKIALKLNVDDSLIATIKCYTTNIVFELTPDNRLIVYSNILDMLLIAEYPAYVSLRHSIPRFGHDAVEDMSSHPERVAYDLPYMMSNQFDSKYPKREWKFKPMICFDPWPYNNRVTPIQLLTMLLKDVFIKEQRNIPEIVDTVYLLVPLDFDLDPRQTDEIADDLKVKVIVDRINNVIPQEKSRCTVM
uniref:Glycos_transf_1 domain-containing protein n=1 Tax=Panagrellus redivivus TaxID=6233 RepID=A0A7E4UYP2_PANRE